MSRKTIAYRLAQCGLDRETIAYYLAELSASELRDLVRSEEQERDRERRQADAMWGGSDVLLGRVS